MTGLNDTEEVDYGYGQFPDEEASLVSSCFAMSEDFEASSVSTQQGSAEEIARRESIVVAWLRGAVISVLVLATVLVSSVVYTSSSHAEKSDFNNAFEDASTKVIESFREKVQHKLGAIDSFALDISSFARSTNSSWPMVTLSDFDLRGLSTRSLADASSVTLLPIVKGETLTAWEDYSVQHQDWVPQGMRLNPSSQMQQQQKTRQVQEYLEGIPSHIFNANGSVSGPGPFVPVWQTSPIMPGMTWMVNMDMLSLDSFAGGLNVLLENQTAVLGRVSNLKGSDRSPSSALALSALLPSEGPKAVPREDPASALFYPVFEHYGSQSDVVAVVAAMLSWRYYFTDVLPLRAKGIVCVVKNACGQAFTYRVDGDAVLFMGEGDLHDEEYKSMYRSINLAGSGDHAISSARHYSASMLSADYCRYSLSVYPSKIMENEFITSRPTRNSFLVAFIFFFACFLFVIYDCMVELRQKVVMDRALQSTAIVQSLFPEQFRERLFRRSSNDGGAPQEGRPGLSRTSSSRNITSIMEPANFRLKSFLSDGDDANRQGGTEDRPIADLFPNCTVLFADLAGFTAWSSLRDPAQVFTLLESVYQAFDRIARKRGVFKVETIGDSYVAVTGLPDPQENHAVIMALFARDCQAKMKEVTRELEMTLGPDTGDLSMRFGLHSGPVTAGVLRGEKSRFQLFGDTVNTAARMESTGKRDRIQMSQLTADLLTEAGRGRWVRAREDLVTAKGKGKMQTYWLESTSRVNSLTSEGGRSTSSDSSKERSGNVLWGGEDEIPELEARSKHQRLVDYNVDVMCQHLKRIVARRMSMTASGRRASQGNFPPILERHCDDERPLVIEEVSETIRLPGFDPRLFKEHVDPDTIELDPEAVSQLKRYVTIVGAMYRNNPFHNFEHASHVTMSVNKLLQRVVQPQLKLRRESVTMSKQSLHRTVAADLHEYTYGITSDPLTQFGIVFGALIHDVDHWGVSNQQLVKEKVAIAQKYKNKSVAEQNSVDLAWNLLLDSEEYGALQKVIFPTDAEYKRFRQVVVNAVMATDIMDKELSTLRKIRWQKAFDDNEDTGGAKKEDQDADNRKATIVIEHIMQASDVAHTMQHWHVYQKWNRRLFDELYTAYKAGRMDTDPTSFWYQGELGFFDHYIIPLAKKLKDCGVFGVSSDECLSYAIDNRREWESKGQMIISELVASFEARDREDAQTPPARRKKMRYARRRSLITTGG